MRRFSYGIQREFYRNKTEIGWALGPEEAGSCLGYCASFIFGTWSVTQHCPSPKNQSPQWQLLETMAAAAALPKWGVGLTPRGQGGQTRMGLRNHPHPSPFYRYNWGNQPRYEGKERQDA